MNIVSRRLERRRAGDGARARTRTVERTRAPDAPPPRANEASSTTDDAREASIADNGRGSARKYLLI